MNIKVLYENKDFVICVKPCLVPSQPDLSGDEDMTSLLNEHFRADGEKATAFVVHRLDRCTGGVMVYAKSKGACSYLSGIVADKDRFTKEYLAVVSGTPSHLEGRFEDCLFRDSVSGKAYVVSGCRKGAKKASLDYSTLATQEERNCSLVWIRLNTGRFHQIRIQFASRKMPVLGDGKYGSREKLGGIALWSYRIGFSYGGKSYSFAELPDTTQKVWNFFDLGKILQKNT